MNGKQPTPGDKGPKLVDLFAGAGGLSCGLEWSGFKPLFASEINPIYASTYKRNHPGTVCHVEDIRQLSTSQILEAIKLKPGALDLLAGGPPCQGFSINAPIRSTGDRRNHLFLEFIRLAQGLNPKFILIENVPGILSFDHGGTVKAIYKELEGLGYRVEHKILFAGHYGIPQLRFRTFFLAARTAKFPDWPEPTHYSVARANFTSAKKLCLPLLELMQPLLRPQSTVMDAISDLPPLNAEDDGDGTVRYASPPKSVYQTELRNGSATVANHRASRLASINHERLKFIPQGGSWRDIPPNLLPAGLKRARRSDHTKRYGRLHPDGMCSTILTKCDPHWGCFFHPCQDRIISVREAARFQSFPDSYSFLGSLVQQYEQVGNAVPPLLAKAIGLEIRRMI